MQGEQMHSMFISTSSQVIWELKNLILHQQLESDWNSEQEAKERESYILRKSHIAQVSLGCALYKPWASLISLGVF